MKLYYYFLKQKSKDGKNFHFLKKNTCNTVLNNTTQNFLKQYVFFIKKHSNNTNK